MRANSEEEKNEENTSEETEGEGSEDVYDHLVELLMM